MTVSAYGAIILSLPIILYQLYAYVLPAFSPQERRVVLPILLLFPVLFLAGIAFAYFVVMPAAVKFLLNFNDTQFNIQVRARDYYSFFSMTMLAGALVFQLPLAILAVTRLGIVKVEQLHGEPPLRLPVDRDHRRGAARRRPGLDDHRDGPAPRSVRVEYLDRQGPRQAGGVGGRGGALDPGVESEQMASGGNEHRMVFDIRGRRRHVVKVVYAILALLMGASLFLVVGAGQHRQPVRTARTTVSSAASQYEEQARTDRTQAGQELPEDADLLLGADQGPDQRRQRLGRTELRTENSRLTSKSLQQLRAGQRRLVANT